MSSTDTTCPHCQRPISAPTAADAQADTADEDGRPLLATRLFQPTWIVLILGGFALLIADMLPLGGTGTAIPGIVLAATGIAMFVYSRMTRSQPPL